MAAEIKITKRGIPPGERLWYGACHSCGSEATATEAALMHITHDQREGSFSWEICPVCKTGDKSTGYGGMLFYPEKKK